MLQKLLEYFPFLNEPSPLLFVCLVSTRGKTGVLVSSEFVGRVGGIVPLILCPGAVREMNDMVK